MKKYLLITILGFFLLAYLLEAVVEPLRNSTIGLGQPYAYFHPAILSRYPFSTAIILIRSLGICLTPVLLATFIDKNQLAKGGSFLIISALIQLYAVQDIASNAQVVPLEWSIALAGGGALLLIPAVIYLVQGVLLAIHNSLVNKVRTNIASHAAQKPPSWMEQSPSN